MATVLVSIFVPEETTNGISGTLLTIIYLVNVILGILCELLTSKQSKWSFFIYIFVEIIEIAKIYSTDNSPSFINGLLAVVIKNKAELIEKHESENN